MGEAKRNRQKKRKLLWLSALLTLSGATVLLVRRVSHPSLLDKATKTAFVLSPEYGFGSPYQWLSTREVLVFDTIKNSANQNGIALYRVGSITGSRVRLTQLERSLLPNSLLPYYSRVSPDGKRLLVFKGSEYQVANLGDGRIHTWQSTQRDEFDESYNLTSVFWQNDSRHIVQLLSSTARETRALLTWDVDAPTTAQRTPLPDIPELDAQNYYSLPSITPSGILFAYAPTEEENDTRTLLLVRAAPHPVKTKTTLHAPPGTTFAAFPARRGAVLTLSPDGTRVAWLCKSSLYAPPLRAWLHRFLPRVNDDPVYTMRLVVSGVDGSAAHEIGSVEVETIKPRMRINVSRTGWQEVWNPDQEISDLRWLPDGKRLSFVLQNALFTVSAED